MRALSVIALLGACGGAAMPVEAPPKTPPVGISIAVYIGQHVTSGFVDDRRSIEVTAGSIVIPQVSPDADFSSFVVEPVDGKPLEVTHCGRERIAKTAQDSAHCAVSGTHGTRIVRVMYALGYVQMPAHHRIELATDGTGTLATQLTFATPKWDRDAEVRIYDGESDRPQKTLPLAQATVTLDGQAAVITPPARMIKGRLRTIFENDPAVVQPDTIQVWAELSVDRLVPGEITVSAAHDGIVSPDLVVSDEQRHPVTSRLSLPLWTDPSITVVRTETQVQRSDRATDMRYTLTLSNSMPKAREVWIYHSADEHRVVLHGGSPGTPTLSNGLMRMPVTVPAKGTARAEYTLTYLP